MSFKKLISVGVILRIVLILFVCGSSRNPILAQNYIDILKLETSSTSRDFENQPEELGIHDYNINLFVPIVISNQDAVLLGFDYESVNSEFSSTEYFDVFSTGLRIGYNKIVSEDLSVSVLLLPKLTGETKDISQANQQLGVAAIARRNLKQGSNFKAGIYINKDLFGPFVVPILGYYSKSDQKEINFLFPSLIDVNYNLNNALKAGIRFNGTVKSYALNNSNRTVDNYLVKTENQLGGYIDYNYKNVHLNLFGGYSAGSSYRIFAENDEVDLAVSILKFGDDRTQLNSDLEDGFIFKATIYYRVKTN